VGQPQLPFVTVKSAQQQARLVVHRLRQGWQEERTAETNRLKSRRVCPTATARLHRMSVMIRARSGWHA
jgi:hypothetical protein